MYLPIWSDRFSGHFIKETARTEKPWISTKYISNFLNQGVNTCFFPVLEAFQFVFSPSYLAPMIQNLTSLLIFGVCMYILKVFTHCFEWLYGNKNVSSPAGQSLWLVLKPDLKFQLSRASRLLFVSNPDIKKNLVKYGFTLSHIYLKYILF